MLGNMHVAFVEGNNESTDNFTVERQEQTQSDNSAMIFVLFLFS